MSKQQHEHQHQHDILKLQQLGLLNDPLHTNINTTNNNANINSSDAIKNSNNAADSPWYIQVFLGGSGILASLFFVGFLTLLLFQASIFENTSLQLVIGIVLSVIGWVLFQQKALNRSPFWQSVAFAISAAGQLYVVFAIFSSEFGSPLNTWLLLGLQVLMTLIMPSFVYRLCSSVVALGCVAYLLGTHQLPELILGTLALIMTVANLQRNTLLQRLPNAWRTSVIDISHAVTYASASWLIVFSVYIVNAEYSRDFISNMFVYNYSIAQGLLIAASLYATYLLLKRYNYALFSKPSLITMSIVVLLSVLSVYAAGLLAISLIIISAMANSQRVLLGIGVFALISYIFWYYYQLDTSLLLKSVSMLLIGISILLLRWWLLKYINSSDINDRQIDKNAEKKENNQGALL